jgi:hypothetical protein
MLQWPGKVMSWSRADILRAIDNIQWQTFRRNLKRRPTVEKLDLLDKYLKDRSLNCDIEDKVRVDNYINALRRGGFLDENYRVVR